MMYLKVYDQKTEYFLWVILMNQKDFEMMKKNRIHLPIIPDMLNCHEIVFIYHESKQETLNFINSIKNKDTKFYGNKEDFLNE